MSIILGPNGRPLRTFSGRRVIRGTAPVVDPPPPDPDPLDVMWFDHDFVASNGSPWPEPFETQLVTGSSGGAIDIQSNRGRMQVHNESWSTGRARTNMVAGNSRLHLRELSQPSTATQYPILGVRASGWSSSEPWYPHNGYTVELPPMAANSLRLERLDNGSRTLLSSLPFTFSPNVNYDAIFEVIGSEIKFKIWPSNESEPDWMLTANDNTHTEGDQIIALLGGGTGGGRRWDIGLASLYSDVPAPEPPPPPPPPDTEYDMAFYSTDDVTRLQNRASGDGPYYTWGDASHGAHTPNDGERILALAQDYHANPSSSFWVAPVPMASGTAWFGENEPTELASRPLAAALCSVARPDHPNRESWRANVKQLLLDTANHPNHDFTDDSKYPISFLGFAPSPIFAHSGWVYRMLKMYDLLGRSYFSSSELALLDRWFWGWANYAAKHFATRTTIRHIPGRYSFDFATTHSDLTGPYEQNGSNFRPYDGGPFVSAGGAFANNRTLSQPMIASAVCHYFIWHDVTPGTGGTQPAYGWFTRPEMLLEIEVAYRAWLHFSVSPLGYTFDFHRGGEPQPPTGGFGYAANEIAKVLSIAVDFARRGDMSLLNLSTSGGHENTAGSPSSILGSVASDFPGKSMEFVLWSLSRYVNDAWGRRQQGVPLIHDKPYHDVLLNAKFSRYGGPNPIITSAWRRSGNNFPAHAAPPVQGQGRWNGYGGVQSLYLGGLLEEAP